MSNPTTKRSGKAIGGGALWLVQVDGVTVATVRDVCGLYVACSARTGKTIGGSFVTLALAVAAVGS